MNINKERQYRSGWKCEQCFTLMEDRGVIIESCYSCLEPRRIDETCPGCHGQIRCKENFCQKCGYEYYWTCIFCSSRTNHKFSKCRICNSSKSSGENKKGDFKESKSDFEEHKNKENNIDIWICDGCSHVNDICGSKCIKCEKGRFESNISSRFQEIGIWLCPKCSRCNSLKSENCETCSTSIKWNCMYCHINNIGDKCVNCQRDRKYTIKQYEFRDQTLWHCLHCSHLNSSNFSENKCGKCKKPVPPTWDKLDLNDFVEASKQF